jgi:hypothetical protein
MDLAEQMSRSSLSFRLCDLHGLSVLGDIGRDPPRLVFAEQSLAADRRSGSPS